MYDCPSQLGKLADTSWILEVRLHVQNYVKEDLEYGSHSKIKKIGGSPNVGDVLGTEFEAHRGRVMVSRTNRPSHHRIFR